MNSGNDVKKVNSQPPAATGLSERYRDETEVCNGERACAAPADLGHKNTLTALSMFAWPISNCAIRLLTFSWHCKGLFQPFLSDMYDDIS